MTEIEELRAEVAKLREEIVVLKLAGPVVHYHHHEAQPLTYMPNGQPAPYYPGGPLSTTCEWRNLS